MLARHITLIGSAISAVTVNERCTSSAWAVSTELLLPAVLQLHNLGEILRPAKLFFPVKPELTFRCAMS
jgi:hypothetical protein